MAIFGNIEVLKKQIKDTKFLTAFDYLTKVLDESSKENKRLNAYDLDVFEKIELDENNFALEQTYFSKEREKCFFESHRQNIDVQFILEGEEIIEVADNHSLTIDVPYRESMDLIKYHDTKQSSQLLLRKGDVAIFFPNDAHMPCIKVNEPVNIIKTVVKVKV